MWAIMDSMAQARLDGFRSQIRCRSAMGNCCLPSRIWSAQIALLRRILSMNSRHDEDDMERTPPFGFLESRICTN
jgi:hypothetical protein